MGCLGLWLVHLSAPTQSVPPLPHHGWPQADLGCPLSFLQWYSVISRVIQELRLIFNYGSQGHSFHLYPAVRQRTRGWERHAILCIFALSYLTLCDPMDCSPPCSSVYGDSPGKNTGVSCHSLLQGVFPTQGSNPSLLHCRQSLFHLSYQESTYVVVETGKSKLHRVDWPAGDPGRS